MTLEEGDEHNGGVRGEDGGPANSNKYRNPLDVRHEPGVEYQEETGLKPVKSSNQ